MMRTLFIICTFILTASICTAQNLPSDPDYRIAYQEAFLEGIRMLPEEERFIYLSYTRIVNYHYYGMVEEMIVCKGIIQAMKSDGMAETDQAYLQKEEELEHFKQILRRETKRFLGYQELEIKIGRKALETLSSMKLGIILRRDYYNALTFRFRIEELKKMPEKEMFLYLCDRSPTHWSFSRLIDHKAQYKKELNELQSKGVDKEDERYRRAEKGYKRGTEGIRQEAERVLKVWSFQAINLDSAWRKALEQLEKQKQRTASGILFPDPPWSESDNEMNNS